MRHLTAYKISVSLSFLKWNDFFLSYPLINVANINPEIDKKNNHFIFDQVQKLKAN